MLGKDTPIRFVLRHDQAVQSLCISSSVGGDITCVTGGDDKVVRLWNLTGAESGELSPKAQLTGHDREINCLEAINIRDRALVVSAGFEKDALVWDLDKSSPVCRLQGHTSAINAVTHGSSDDGDFLFTCSSTGSEVLFYHVEAVLTGEGRGTAITDYVKTPKTSIEGIRASKGRLLVLEKVNADESSRGWENWCEPSSLCLRFF